ncbi:hypothetical protein T5B8_08884 [Salinisphaera sp. T5B8]
MRRLSARADVGDSGDRSRNKKTAMGYKLIGELMDSVARVDAFIWERTQRHGGLAAARERGIPTVAVGHNLESLVPTETLLYSDGGLHDRFAAECGQLALADHRVVISSRDQWLLALFGVESIVLPYHPPQHRLHALRQVRARRQQPGRHKRVLIMGNAMYPPTYEGMRHLLQVLIGGGLTGGATSVDVMGFGAERLAADCTGDGIVFHGAVSDVHMFNLMTTATAAIVYQKTGTGALTRIPDFLAAGLPVLANPCAARAHEHLEGVHLFHDDADLVGVVESLDTQALPAEPAFPERAAQRFIACLEQGGCRN